MTPQVSQYINKTILVSIPTLFHDAKCRPLKLIGVEVPGLWLQADELAARLLPDPLQDYASAAPVIFVPFAQIAGILIPTRQPTVASAPSAGSQDSAAAILPPAGVRAARAKKDKPPQTEPQSPAKS